ncbi:hypothetical protein BDR26DRAFT_851293 [Obelidium mucronatum]|nr:hypothetical protein BDR26DRAFT_851293 [Obelidium mucronatum]
MSEQQPSTKPETLTNETDSLSDASDLVLTQLEPNPLLTPLLDLHAATPQPVQPPSPTKSPSPSPFKSPPIVSSTQLHVFSSSPKDVIKPYQGKTTVTVVDEDPAFEVGNTADFTELSKDALLRGSSLPISVPRKSGLTDATAAGDQRTTSPTPTLSGYHSLIDAEGGELRSIDAVAVLKGGKMRSNGIGNGGSVGDLSSGLANPSPVSQKRNKDWHDLFPNIDPDELLLDDWVCAWQREVLLQGRMYLSERHICFNANIFGWSHSLTLDLDDMVSVEKKSIGGFIPNSIEIATMLGQKHYFASFIARDSTYEAITRQWGNSSRAIRMKTFNKEKHALVDTPTVEDQLDDASSETSLEYLSSSAKVSAKTSPVKLNEDTTRAPSIDAIGMWSLSMIRGNNNGTPATPKVNDSSTSSRPSTPVDEYAARLNVMDRRLSAHTIAQIKGLAELASKSEPTSPTSVPVTSSHDPLNSGILNSSGSGSTESTKNTHVVHQKHPVVLPVQAILEQQNPLVSPPSAISAFIAASPSFSSPPDSPNASIIDLTPHLESIERRKGAVMQATKPSTPTPSNLKSNLTPENSLSSSHSVPEGMTLSLENSVLPIQLAAPESLISVPKSAQIASDPDSVVWTGAVKPKKSSKRIARSLSRETSSSELQTTEADSHDVSSENTVPASDLSADGSPSNHAPKEVRKILPIEFSPDGTSHLPPLPSTPTPSQQNTGKSKPSSPNTSVSIQPGLPRSGSPLKEIPSPASRGDAPGSPSLESLELSPPSPQLSPQLTSQPLQPPVIVPEPPKNTPTTCPCREFHAKLTPVLISIYPNTSLETVWNTFYSTPSKISQFLSQYKNVTSGYKSTDWNPNQEKPFPVFTSDAVPDASLYVTPSSPSEYTSIKEGFERRGEYVTPLTNPMGPKSTRCFVSEVITVVGGRSRPGEPQQQGECFCIFQSSVTPDVPIRICWTRSGVEGGDARVEISCEAEFVKSSWIQGIIQGAVIDGMKTYYKDFDLFLRDGLKEAAQIESQNKLKSSVKSTQKIQSTPPSYFGSSLAGRLNQPLTHPLEDEMELMNLQIQGRRQPAMVSLITLNSVKYPPGSERRRSRDHSLPPPRGSSLMANDAEAAVPIGSIEFWKAVKVVGKSLVASPWSILGFVSLYLVLQIVLVWLLVPRSQPNATHTEEIKSLVSKLVEEALVLRGLNQNSWVAQSGEEKGNSL